MLIALSDIGVKTDRAWASVLAPYNVSVAEYRVLSVIVELGNPKAIEIAELVPVDQSFISRLVQQLYEKQLVSRQRSLTDRRTVILEATTAGKELLRQLAQPLQNMERQMVRGISENELNLAVSVIAAMTGNVEEA